MIGDGGHDTQDAGEGNDILDGDNGYDVLFGREGDDRMSGGRCVRSLEQHEHMGLRGARGRNCGVERSGHDMLPRW